MTAIIVAERDFIAAAADLDSSLGGRLWRTLRKLQQDPTPPGLNLERLEGTDTIESCRMNRDVRVILCRRKTPPPPTIHLMFVGHHDDAYKWVKNRLSRGAVLRRASLDQEVDYRGIRATPATRAAESLSPRWFVGDLRGLRQLVRLYEESLRTLIDSEVDLWSLDED